MFKTYLGKKIAPHFAKINQFYETLPFNSEKEKSESENRLFKKNGKDHICEHYYLDGSFDSSSIISLIKLIKKNKQNEIYYKIIVIKDQIREAF